MHFVLPITEQNSTKPTDKWVFPLVFKLRTAHSSMNLILLLKGSYAIFLKTTWRKS